MLAPCKDCAERKQGCHSKCQKYADFAEWNAENREKRHMAAVAPEGWKRAMHDLIRKRRK